jgi:hypothetical protein
VWLGIDVLFDLFPKLRVPKLKSRRRFKDAAKAIPSAVSRKHQVVAVAR